MRLAHASTAAITHSEIGTALAPRAHVTVRPVEDRSWHIVDTGARELHPPHAAGVEPAHDVVPPHVAAEEHVGLQARRAGRPALNSMISTSGSALADSVGLRRRRAELSDDPHESERYASPLAVGPKLCSASACRLPSPPFTITSMCSGDATRCTSP